MDYFVIAIPLFLVVSSGLAFALYTLTFPEVTAADRLEKLTNAAFRGESSSITGRDDVAVEVVAASLGRLAKSTDVEQVADLRATLTYAGYRHRRAMEVFAGLRVVTTFGFMALPAPTVFYFDNILNTILFMVAAAAAGYYIPVFVLQLLATNRQNDLLNAYPDALDLLVISVESGLGLDAAFRRVATEMRTVSPALAQEFGLVNNEIAAGIERMLALQHLQDRTGLDDVRSLVNMLQQAERYGSSIAKSLRLYSNLGREKRIARAEEKAGQVSSKLTIIMIIFLLPVLMAILLGPSAIRIKNNLVVDQNEVAAEEQRIIDRRGRLDEPAQDGVGP